LKVDENEMKAKEGIKEKPRVSSSPDHIRTQKRTSRKKKACNNKSAGGKILASFLKRIFYLTVKVFICND
jgi:hypothetical protein